MSALSAFAEFPVQQADDVSRDTREQGVSDALRFARGRDNTRLAQHGKMLRKGGLAQGDALVQLAHRKRALHEGAEDHQTLLVRQCLEQCGSLSRVRLDVLCGAGAQCACLRSRSTCQ